jgi:hypothetical protein
MIVNISTRSDADFIRTFVYQTTLGVPVDLTGSTLHMMARVHAADVTVMLDLTMANGDITITNAAAGQFSIWIPLATLSRLPANNYDHSLIRYRPDLKTEEIWYGTLTHTIGATR